MDGIKVRLNTTRYFDPDQIDSTVERVYHDGTDPLIPWAHEQRGIESELIPEVRGETVHGDPEPDYRVEQNGPWYSLIGPDGKVGKSQRSEDDAWALLDEEG